MTVECKLIMDVYNVRNFRGNHSPIGKLGGIFGRNVGTTSGVKYLTGYSVNDSLEHGGSKSLSTVTSRPME